MSLNYYYYLSNLPYTSSVDKCQAGMTSSPPPHHMTLQFPHRGTWVGPLIYLFAILQNQTANFPDCISKTILKEFDKVCTFQKHPSKSTQKEEVEQTSNNATEESLVCLTYACQKQDLCDQQAHTEILVNRCSVRLQQQRTQYQTKD